MRRILPILVVILTALFGLPATASAAPTPIGGGSILFNPLGSFTNRCTVAFAARNSTAEYLIAGPGCVVDNSTQLYSGNNVPVGPVVGSPNYGYVVVAVTNTAAWDVVGWIDTGIGRYSIRGSLETPVGGSVCLLGRSSGVMCGSILAKNVTVTFPSGTITGLTRTNVCMEPGAIAFVTYDQAQGVPVAGSGSCSTGGYSYFYPVNRILAAYRLTLLAG